VLLLSLDFLLHEFIECGSVSIDLASLIALVNASTLVTLSLNIFEGKSSLSLRCRSVGHKQQMLFRPR
jgi:hypothetical protein